MKYEYESFTNFKYLGTFITNIYKCPKDISRLARGTRSFYSLLVVFCSSFESKNTEVRLYTTIICPVVSYASEKWTLTVMYEERQNTKKKSCEK